MRNYLTDIPSDYEAIEYPENCEACGYELESARCPECGYDNTIETEENADENRDNEDHL
jgi:hypothetical protein